MTLRQEVGSQAVSLAGLHDPEHNDRFSYAYTRGETEVRFPQTGAGHFMVSLRMAGPNETVPVAARVATPSRQLSLGTVEQLRVYHLLLPTNLDGDLQFGIHSATTLMGDSRQLGVLLDWLQIRSLATLIPPPELLLSTPLALLLVWCAAAQLFTSYRRKLIVLLLAGAILSSIYSTCRGRLALQPWWLISPGLVITAAVFLYRVDWRQAATTLRQLASKVDVGWRRLMLHLNQLREHVTNSVLRPRRSEGAGILLALRPVTGMFIVWRVALWLIGGIGLWFSSTVYPLVYQMYRFGDPAWHRGEMVDGRLLWLAGNLADRKKFLWELFAESWLQWDSHHYAAIAFFGYQFPLGHQPNIAFFPLYPVLMRLVLPLSNGNLILAGLVVAHLALFAALLLLYDLVACDFGQKVAQRTIVLLLVFPTSLFLGAVYTESLALALAVAALWAMQRQRWWLAGAAGGLLALTRLPGVMMAPVIAIVYLQYHSWRWRAIRPDFLAVLLPPLGLALFMLFQWWYYGTPVAFFDAQRDWESHISTPWALPMGLFRWLQNPGNLWPLLVFQLVIWGCFSLLLLVTLRRLPLPYGLTALFLLLPPLLNNKAHGLPRYVLLGFPTFIVLAMLAERPWVRRIVISVMLLFLVVETVLFVNGFWVA